MHVIGGLALGLMVAATGAAAAAGCGGDATQLDLDRCAGEDFRKADAALNDVYREVVERLHGDVATRELLTKAQKSWLGFRDAECAFTASGSQGGSVHPMVVAGCRATLTAARTRTLRGYLDCKEGDMDCPLPPK